ncbi:tetraacyldisaccharide 4'-kinase [Aquamicrobium sp. NLF2-7]|uniref:tetraacyldisaccharide 4'-kinase n=1 Tax=Aquamicrobium sp. NLF2-7 TaxID=2918753 RepID=UPI001EFB4546|nr:tetraacyldisaccharide 4'-kinase [Aquamicrobium sp. NLF2-7]MCG8270450.1 tetraacyldisaccharide 4'-kinase [Aquamicrobium sp. NLF2-7]
MASEAPPFWWEKPDWRALALSPLAAAYSFVAGRKLRNARREKMHAPVLCIGNFTVGGTGKTPVAITFAEQARAMGFAPGILSRGHGGGFSTPHVVDPHHDAAKHVGDEPLLLAAHAPVAVTANRAAGARLLLEQEGCNFLIMDDGFQSARIHIDYALLVVDSGRGLGNGKVIPAGPLRAKIVDQLVYTDALLRMGDGSAADGVVRQAARAGKPVFDAGMQPLDGERFAGRRFLAFAGIGHPEKFFDTVTRAGATVVQARPFPDHHFYDADELAGLLSSAKAEGLELITTAKDAVRLRHGAVGPGFLDKLNVLKVATVFDQPHTPVRIINETVEAWKLRRVAG